MAKFRVFMTRTRTIKEHAVVVVQSTGEAYAKQDAVSAANRNGEWLNDSSDCSAPNFHHIEEL